SYVQNDLCSTERKQLVDQHQVISIIATAIYECFKERPEQEIGPEEAKQIAKCVIEALVEAGLEIGVHNES
ncbi:MAG TPA: hypothetical protein VK620_32735, partial [Bradyrhizobium sp.]|nr:hypothetical protein [Bradyrhizobium sp.]